MGRRKSPETDKSANSGRAHNGSQPERARRRRRGRGRASEPEETPPSAPATSPEPPSASEPPSAPDRYAIELDPELIDQDAAKVVRRLVRHGFEAYLVGGCVRDLLLDCSPKDFDVATNARPDDVRTLFRNSRIIGRRFRLVHVLFSGGKIIETATFRKTPQQSDERATDDLLIRDDNVFGEAHEDAVRRDFTINGLFYDLESNEVLDWVGGIPDIRARTVRTIGDPVVRFLEDPVRILRAIKFCARLDLGIAPDVYDAIVQCRGSLAMAARPRLFEEVLRLMRGGASHRSVWLMWETGVLDVLLPELAAYLSDTQESDGSTWALFSAIDRETKQRGEAFDDVVLWTALLLEPMLEACEGASDRVEAAFDFLEPVVDRLNVPRRIADGVRRIVAMMPRLQTGRPGRFARTPLYDYAAEVVDLANKARGVAIKPSRDAAPKKKRRR
ncbi:MAG: polynucleotide adenylyltransferase PcnB [Polyangiaceae bacterium]